MSDFAGVVVETEKLLDGLRARNFYSLPMLVVPAIEHNRSAALQAVRRCIDIANTKGAARIPPSPTWSSDADLTPAGIVTEVARGTMEEADVRAWLHDFEEALRDADISCRVVPNSPNEKVLNADAWNDQIPAQPSAFLFYVPELRDDSIAGMSLQMLGHLCGPLARWARFPSSTGEVSSGLSRFVCSDEQLESEFLASARSDYMASLRCYTREPRQMRMARLGAGARLYMQVCQEGTKPSVSLRALLDGLRAVGAGATYGFVRLGRAAGPDEFDTLAALGRPPTTAELFCRDPRALPLLESFVPDTYVAQILTEAHLAQAGDLSGFDVEQLGNGRRLVVAKEPSEWLDTLTSSEQVANRGRRAFGRMLLSEDDITQAMRSPRG